MSKIKRIIPYTKLWERLANIQARNFAPYIHPCVECGRPTIKGYCCNFCGSVDPTGNPEQRKEFQEWVSQTSVGVLPEAKQGETK